MIRQRTRRQPAVRPATSPAAATFWVAACAGIIVFGTLMGAVFVGQQFLQNVLGYSTLRRRASILPAAVFMVLVAPRSAKLVESAARGSRCSSGTSSASSASSRCCFLWKRGHRPYLEVGLGYAFIGIGVGFAARRLRTRSPVGPGRRAGMASGTADLQRDLGGAIMQSILGRS